MNTHSTKPPTSLTSTPVKIFEQGLISGTENAGIWAGDAIFETLNATITVPNGLAGEYMFRHELIALHQANNPQCTFPLTTLILQHYSAQLTPLPSLSRMRPIHRYGLRHRIASCLLLSVISWRVYGDGTRSCV